MATQEFTGCCQCGLGLGTVGLQSQLLEYAINQVWLSQVNSPIIVMLDVDTKEVRDISLDCQLQSCSFHVFDDLVQFLEIQSG